MFNVLAAFDAIDYYMLLQRLKRRKSVEDVAVRWIKEYHKGRTQATIINGAVFNHFHLTTVLRMGQ